MLSAIVAKGERMGEVLRSEKHYENNWVLLLIKRDHPPCIDRPYMTIRGYWRNGEASLELGHYDLDAASALISFAQRIS